MKDTMDLVEQTLELFETVDSFDWYEYHDSMQAALIEMFLDKHDSKASAARAMGMNRTTLMMRKKNEQRH